MQDKKDENQYIKQYIQILNFELWLCVLRFSFFAIYYTLHAIRSTLIYEIRDTKLVLRFVFETNDYSLFTND